MVRIGGVLCSALLVPPLLCVLTGGRGVSRVSKVQFNLFIVLVDPSHTQNHHSIPIYLSLHHGRRASIQASKGRRAGNCKWHSSSSFQSVPVSSQRLPPHNSISFSLTISCIGLPLLVAPISTNPPLPLPAMETPTRPGQRLPPSPPPTIHSKASYRGQSQSIG
jgi:hypothetical protein